MKTKILFLLAILAVAGATYTASAQKPTASLAGKSSGKATVKQLLKDSVLTVTTPGYVVVSFRMSAYAKGVDATDLESSSAQLTARMQQTISQLPRGTKIYFEFIQAHDAEGTIVTLEPMAFIIK